MTESQKESIVATMEAYIADKGITNSKLADLAGISPAYITHLINRRWNEVPSGAKTAKMGDATFQSIARTIGFDMQETFWAHFDTINYCEAIVAYQDARALKIRRAIDGPTGSGKTYSADKYCQDNPIGTYKVTCADDLTAKGFMQEMAEAVGINTTGSRSEIRKAIIKKLGAEKSPLLIIDEAENLKDSSYGALKAICDDLEGKCGIVINGANNYEKKLARKALNETSCFPQIYRRFKNGFVQMYILNQQEIREYCQELGITLKGSINAIFALCLNMGELHHVIVQLKRIAAEQNQEITPEFIRQIFPSRN